MTNKTIHKYLINLTDESAIKIPRGAEILSVAMHPDDFFKAYLWAKVNLNNPIVDRKISCRGTGHPLTGSEGCFIGTVFPHDGLVIHIFAET